MHKSMYSSDYFLPVVFGLLLIQCFFSELASYNDGHDVFKFKDVLVESQFVTSKTKLLI